MKRSYLFLMCALIYLNVNAQRKKLNHVSVALTTLHTVFPLGSFGKLFQESLHPGVEIGTGFNWKTKTRYDWFQTFQFGYSYHRFVQHTLALYSETGYRYRLPKAFSAEAKLGAGYLHAVPVEKIFILNEDGTYKKKVNLGRPQVLAALSFGIHKNISTLGTSVFVNYQQRLQLPFIKSYVPLLPSNMLMAGVKIPLKPQQTTKR